MTNPVLFSNILNSPTIQASNPGYVYAVNGAFIYVLVPSTMTEATKITLKDSGSVSIGFDPSGRYLFTRNTSNISITDVTLGICISSRIAVSGIYSSLIAGNKLYLTASNSNLYVYNLTDVLNGILNNPTVYPTGYTAANLVADPYNNVYAYWQFDVYPFTDGIGLGPSVYHSSSGIQQVFFSGNYVGMVLTSTMLALSNKWVPISPTLAISAGNIYTPANNGLFSVTNTASNNTNVSIYYLPSFPTVVATPSGTYYTGNGAADANYLYLGYTNGINKFSLSTYTLAGALAVTSHYNAGPYAVFTSQNLVTQQTLNLAQVPSSQTWNVSVSSSQPTAAGVYTLYSGTRVIATANIGQNVGPFTAYPGEQISASLPSGCGIITFTGSGTAYNAPDEKAPTLFPGISG